MSGDELSVTVHKSDRWEGRELHATRWMDAKSVEPGEHWRLLVSSPEGDAAVTIQEQRMAGRRSRAKVVERRCMFLTPNEALWLYEQLHTLMGKG